MAVKDARLYVIPSLVSWTSYTLKCSVWRQSLQSTYGEEAFVDIGYETCSHFDGLWNLISMQIGKVSECWLGGLFEYLLCD